MVVKKGQLKEHDSEECAGIEAMRLAYKLDSRMLIVKVVGVTDTKPRISFCPTCNRYVGESDHDVLMQRFRQFKGNSHTIADPTWHGDRWPESHDKVLCDLWENENCNVRELCNIFRRTVSGITSRLYKHGYDTSGHHTSTYGRK